MAPHFAVNEQAKAMAVTNKPLNMGTLCRNIATPLVTLIVSEIRRPRRSAHYSSQACDFSRLTPIFSVL